MYHLKEGKLEINDVKMDYITFGKGERTLIMIQGLNTRGIKGAGISLAFLYRIFARKYKVYLFDRRESLYDGITVRNFAEDIAMAMDSFGIQNADVIGVSQGGMIAQYLAIDRPDLVNKLVLAVTLSRNNPVVESAICKWCELAKKGSMRAFVEDMALKMYSDAYVKKYRPFMPLLAVLQKPKDLQRFLILAKSCLTCNAYEELDKIKCPVFVIGGSKDLVVSGEASVELAEKLGCEIYMYDGLGHAAYEEAKDFNERVALFFDN